VQPDGLHFQHTLRGHSGFNTLAFSPDGTRLVSAGGDQLIIWDRIALQNWQRCTATAPA
jgi:WD40 repeat protein